MNAEEIIRFIHDAKKTTPVKAYVKAAGDVAFPGCRVFGAGDRVVFGEWGDVRAALEKNAVPASAGWQAQAQRGLAPGYTYAVPMPAVPGGESAPNPRQGTSAPRDPQTAGAQNAPQTRGPAAPPPAGRPRQPSGFAAQGGASMQRAPAAPNAAPRRESRPAQCAVSRLQAGHALYSELMHSHDRMGTRYLG